MIVYERTPSNTNEALVSPSLSGRTQSSVQQPVIAPTAQA